MNCDFCGPLLFLSLNLEFTFDDFNSYNDYNDKNNHKVKTNKTQNQLKIKQKFNNLTYIIQYSPSHPMNKPHSHVLLSIKNSRKIINLQGTPTQYPIIKLVSLSQLQFQLGVDHYTFLWTDQPLSIKQIRSLQFPKRVNHFPDISQLTRKNKLAMNLNHMKLHFPKHYDFFPETWLTPTDWHKIVKRHTKGKVYIIKPENNCQGKGISLVDNPNKIQRGESLVVQEYLQRPYLIDQLKFDMRIYVLVTCVQPLRVYLYQEGIARFATEKFRQAREDNLDDWFTHLTNYAINKHNSNFNHHQKQGHKRALTDTFQKIEDYTHLMQQVKQIVIKTVISALPSLQNAYSQCKKSDPSSCFQLLGFDIILDDNKKAYLLQVNQNPSLHTDTAIDEKIKSALVKNIFKMVSGGLPNIFEQKLQNKMKLKDRHQLNNIGNFQRIYPCSTLQETEQYDQFFVKSQQIYRQKFGMNIVRNLKKKTVSQINPNQVSFSNQNQKGKKHNIVLNGPTTGFYYSRQKMENIYRAKTRFAPHTSVAKRKPANI